MSWLRRMGQVLILMAVVLYLVLVANFWHLYFFRYQVYASEGWFFSERILANYLRQAQENPAVGVVRVAVREPKIVFEEYLFYSGVYNWPEKIAAVNKGLKNKNFGYGKVVFESGCPETFGESDIVVVDARLGCLPEEGNKGIVSLADGGTVFVIKKDIVCPDNAIRYYRPRDISQFLLERQDRKEFCQNWIVNL